MKERSSSSAQNALLEIRRIREGKLKASEAYKLKEDNIFEEVDEEEYQNIIRERRNLDFVVDDNGIGYEDDGRDIFENYIPLPEEVGPKRGDRKRKKDSSGRHFGGGGSILQQFQLIPGGPRLEKGGKSKETNSKGMDVLTALEDFENSLFEDAEEGLEAEGGAEEKLENLQGPGGGMRSGTSSENLDSVGPERASPIPDSKEDSTQQICSADQLNEMVLEEVSCRESESESEEQLQGKDSKYPKLGDDLVTGSERAPLFGNHLHVFSNKDESLNFYLVEVVEDQGSGELYLFGKIMTGAEGSDQEATESCCVVIKETWRSLYLYPRESLPNHPDPLSVSHGVAKEIIELRKEFRIPKLQMKPVVRNFCFSDKEVKFGPNQPFLKLLYSSRNPSLPANLSGETFSRTFGLNTSLTENFIIKRKIKGPSWLKISKPFQIVPVGGGRKSQCKVEIHTPNWKTIRPWPSASQGGSNNGNKTEDGGGVTRQPDGCIEKTISVSPLLNIVSVNVCSKMPSSGSSSPEIYTISIVSLRSVNIDEVFWDGSTAFEILHGNKTSGVAGIQTWTGIRRLTPSGAFPTGSEDRMDKSGIRYFSTERSLLLAFITAFSLFDPDVVVGHNIWTDHLDVLVSRMVFLGIPNLWKLGKIYAPQQSQKYGIKSFSSTKRIQTVFQGRLICDTCLSSKEFMKSRTDYQLGSIFSEVFPKDAELLRASASKSASGEAYLSETYRSFEGISRALSRDLLMAVGVLKLLFHLQVLPLTRELTNLAGFIWSKSLLFLRAERNEFLLLHEFHRGKFVTPDVLRTPKNKSRSEDPILEGAEREENSSRREETYSGGLVLEPITGLYETLVLLLDFNSLYPSIIQEFNICFTTRDPAEVGQEGSPDPGSLEEAVGLAASSPFGGTVLPGILESLVNRRRHIKEILKSMPAGTRKSQLEIRQLALKLTANSIYGCLGYKNSRFYAKDLASMITYYGRQILQKTKLKVENETKLQVIYGDTDSIMVNTNIADTGNGEGYASVLRLASQIKQIVNKDYTKLELDLDGVLQRLLLLKKKKLQDQAAEAGVQGIGLGSTRLVCSD
ncbi:DNA polymerase alpha catalytic subunit [Cryptosporidium felis]|nr:DNA polymerase alpha catalytic subunit [Cryptosporidium felis]